MVAWREILGENHFCVYHFSHVIFDNWQRIMMKPNTPLEIIGVIRGDAK